eukprot:TRINITY_DN8680_c0_g1_i3.p1 TRINITY_DN8680_c0_g1~~TRINITY_DN8680_c0_g1_i3.p1  ORF type:complete len:328 (+),score=42.81 TRINITY_DN8680_c0_g1_i3:832-1815(+)
MESGQLKSPYPRRICKLVQGSLPKVGLSQGMEMNQIINPMNNPLPNEETFPLFSIDRIPELWRRPFILHGYRLYYSFDRCFQSLFHLHNETGNCWTHLIGFLIFFALNIYLLLASDLPQRGMLMLYLIGVQCCMLFSVLFHLLCCHSQHAFFRFLKLDLCGISGQICTSYFPGIYFGFYCQFHWCVTYLTAISLFALAGVLVPYIEFMHKPENEFYRQMVYISMTCSGIIPATHWVMLAPENERDLFLMYFVGMFALYGVGLLFYMTNFPERWMPGKFDIWFHSHQWWHVCVVGAAYVWYIGCSKYAIMIETKVCEDDTLLPIEASF